MDYGLRACKHVWVGSKAEAVESQKVTRIGDDHMAQDSQKAATHDVPAREFMHHGSRCPRPTSRHDTHQLTPSLLENLRQIARSCSFPESVDLHGYLVASGAEKHGQMPMQRFRGALSTAFPRIHFQEPMMQLLVDAYGCGYEAPRESGARVETHVAWKDFVADVQFLTQHGNEIDDTVPFVPSSTRKAREMTFQTAYNQKI